MSGVRVLWDHFWFCICPIRPGVFLMVIIVHYQKCTNKFNVKILPPIYEILTVRKRTFPYNRRFSFYLSVVTMWREINRDHNGRLCWRGYRGVVLFPHRGFRLLYLGKQCALSKIAFSKTSSKGLIFLVIVVSLCTVGLVPLASHVR